MTTTRRAGLRTAALLAGGAYVLHQARYLAGYGSDSHAELAHQGHGYLVVLAPALGVVLLALAADFGARLIAARSVAAAPRLRSLWAAASGCLLLAYCVQETAEGALASGHPAGLAAVAGRGGWVALPLAAVLGLAIALLVRGGQRALELAAEPRVRIGRPRRQTALIEPAPPRRPHAARSRGSLGARAPPLAAVP